MLSLRQDFPKIVEKVEEKQLIFVQTINDVDKATYSLLAQLNPDEYFDSLDTSYKYHQLHKKHFMRFVRLLYKGIPKKIVLQNQNITKIYKTMKQMNLITTDEDSVAAVLFS